MMQKSVDHPEKRLPRLSSFVLLLGGIGSALLYLSLAMALLPRLIPDLYSGFPYLALTFPVLLLIDLRWERLARMWRQLAIGFMSGLLIYFIAISGIIFQVNAERQPVWDLGKFWIHSRLAVLGQDMYDVELATDMARQLYGEPSEDLLSQIDMPYPPPSMLFIAPIGLADMSITGPIWQWTLHVFLGLSAVLCWRLFFAERGPVGLLFAAALLAAFPGTMETVYMGQTNFVMLALLLLYALDRNQLRSGLWLVIGILLKPTVGVLVLLVLLRREWRTLQGMIYSTIGLCLLAALVFGPQVYQQYVDGLGAVGGSRYLLPYNQSLLSLILRLDTSAVALQSAFNPIFLLLAGLIVVVSSGVILRYRAMPLAEWALVVIIALLVFPHSPSYYSIIALPPVFVCLKSQWSDRARAWLYVMTALVMLFVCTAVPYHYFISYILCMILLMVIIARHKANEHDVPTRLMRAQIRPHRPA
jgi:hypothetical protein